MKVFARSTTAGVLMLATVVSAASAADAPAQFIVTPRSLRERILVDNLHILETLNQVHQAKETVNRDRGNLLPSLNLGAAFSHGNFVISAMSVLLPFLLPSRWFAHAQDEYLLEAEKSGYHATQLNTYAQAYALYATLAGYQQIRDLAESEVQDYQRIEDVLDDGYRLGVVPRRDMEQARAATARARYQLSLWNDKMQASRAAMRAVLNLPLSTEITFAPTSIPTTEWEGAPTETVAQLAVDRAPEVQQLLSLAQAADQGKWTSLFSFIGNFSINAGSRDGGNGSVTFGNSSLNVGTGGGEIGFATYPSIRLSQESRNRVLIQKAALELNTRQTIETVLGSIRAAQEQVTLATASEAAQQRVYDIDQESWELGMHPLFQLLATHVLLTDAGINRINAQIDLNVQRITLQRALREGEFAEIKGCDAHIPNQSGIGGWLKSLFGDGGIESIDEACHPGGSSLPAAS